MPSSAEVAWLAGILEGEGSFLYSRSRTGGKDYFYPKIVVGMTDRDVIARVAALFGTSVYAIPVRPDRKPAFRAQINGTKAATWMVLLRPWMGQRRMAKIDEILALYGAIESTEVRRRRSCSEAAAKRPRVNGRFVTR